MNIDSKRLRAIRDDLITVDDDFREAERLAATLKIISKIPVASACVSIIKMETSQCVGSAVNMFSEVCLYVHELEEINKSVEMMVDDFSEDTRDYIEDETDFQNTYTAGNDVINTELVERVEEFSSDNISEAAGGNGIEITEDEFNAIKENPALYGVSYAWVETMEQSMESNNGNPNVRGGPEEGNPNVRGGPEEMNPNVRGGPEEMNPNVRGSQVEINPNVRGGPEEMNPNVRGGPEEMNPNVRGGPEEMNPNVRGGPEEMNPNVRGGPEEINPIDRGGIEKIIDSGDKEKINPIDRGESEEEALNVREVNE